jgi:hypothetical protein
MLPAAAQYKSLRLQTYGNGSGEPSQVRGAFLNATTKEYDETAGARVSSSARTWYTIGSINAASHYNSQHIVTSSVFVTSPNGYYSDFDTEYVRLVVTYTVWQ